MSHRVSPSLRKLFLGATVLALLSTTAFVSAQSRVTITHWQHHYAAREAVVKSLIQEFEAAHPDIRIDFQSIPYGDYFQKIGPSLEAGTGPDVFQIPGPQVYEFYSRGQLAPVPEAVYSTADIEGDFVPWTIQLLKHADSYVGLPTDVQLLLLFYNNALFEEAGLDPGAGFNSLEELQEAAVALTKRSGNRLTQAGISLTYSPYQWYWNYLTTMNDLGSVDEDNLRVTYNDSAGVAWWQWFTDLITVQHVDDPEFLTGQDKFAVGLAGMDLHEFTYAGNLAQLNPDLEYSIHLPPPAAGRPQGTAGTHWAYVVSAQSQKTDAAWEWVKFLTSEAAQREWVADGGELPSRVSLYDDSDLRSDPNTAFALDAMASAVPYDAIGWDDVYAIQQNIWESIVLQGKDAAEAVAKGAADEEALYESKQRR